MLFLGCTGEHGDAAGAPATVREELAEMRSHLGGDRVLLRDRELTAMPRLPRPPKRGRDDLGERLRQRKDGEGLVEDRRDPLRIGGMDSVDQPLPQIVRPIERDGICLVENARSLPDAPSFGNPIAEPLDPLHVQFGVATLSSRRSHRLQHAVALLPLAQGVGCDAGASCQSCDIEERGRH